MKQGNQRQKGAAFERKVVVRAREYGLLAQRTAPLQAAAGSRDADVTLHGFRIECKHHRRVPVNRLASLTDEPNVVLVWQDNHKRPKVTLDLEGFLALVRQTREPSAAGTAG